VILVVAGMTLAVGIGLIILFGFTGAGPGFVVLGMILFVIFGFLEPESLRAFLGQGELQAGTKAIAQAVLVVGAVILLNMVVRDRLADAKLDVTKGHVNTLAAQTVTVLKGLDSRVDVTVWYGQAASEQDAAYNLLQQYHNVNSNLVVQRYSVIDRPTLAQQQKVTQADSVVFAYKNRAPQVTTGTTEQDFTTSLLRLSTGRSPKAYFLTGHGEGSIDTASASGNSFTALKGPGARSSRHRRRPTFRPRLRPPRRRRRPPRPHRLPHLRRRRRPQPPPAHPRCRPPPSPRTQTRS
jgi:hypothetical protein